MGIIYNNSYFDVLAKHKKTHKLLNRKEVIEIATDPVLLATENLVVKRLKSCFYKIIL